MQDDTERERASFSSVAFLMFAIALAAAIHFVMNDEFERETNRQVTRRNDLAAAVEGQKTEGKELEILRDALKADPQTVERRMRKNGWGRAGDIRIHVAEESK